MNSKLIEFQKGWIFYLENKNIGANELIGRRKLCELFDGDELYEIIELLEEAIDRNSNPKLSQQLSFLVEDMRLMACSLTCDFGLDYGIREKRLLE